MLQKLLQGASQIVTTLIPSLYSQSEVISTHNVMLIFTGRVLVLKKNLPTGTVEVVWSIFKMAFNPFVKMTKWHQTDLLAR